MFTNKNNRFVVYIFLIAIILSACTIPGTTKNNTPTYSTGVVELDKIIDIVQGGDKEELMSVIRLTQAKCTLADGLGGPPKCAANEQEGSIVEGLPIIGAEGYILRKDELGSWNGLDASTLYAVYEVSEQVFSDENYPAGEYAIVIINKDKSTSLTLQVDQGGIVRIDHGLEYPPSIPDGNVVRYLIHPVDAKS